MVNMPTAPYFSDNDEISPYANTPPAYTYHDEQHNNCPPGMYEPPPAYSDVINDSNANPYIGDENQNNNLVHYNTFPTQEEMHAPIKQKRKWTTKRLIFAVGITFAATVAFSAIISVIIYYNTDFFDKMHRVDHCVNKSKSCLNGATCVNLEHSYQCMCAWGYTGFSCEALIDNCASLPCLHNSKCINGIGNYTCDCLAGYHGDRCEAIIDNCLNKPCQNGATCINGINTYSCDCAYGYTGNNCQNIIDNCASSPCEHQSKCINSIGRYTCDCLAGYSGNRCEAVIDNCVSKPCQNGGTCINSINFYSCLCTQGYTGNTCQSKIGCFPGESSVRLINGEVKIMSDLDIGDHVLAYDVITDQFVYSPVILFSHREPEVTTTFLSVKTSNGRNLFLTKNHLVHVFRRTTSEILDSSNNEIHETNTKVKTLFAGDLQRGDSLITSPSPADNITVVHSAIVALQSIERQGVYAPVTHIGTIVVDDVVASCYCEIIDHDRVHATFGLFRLVYNMFSKITQNEVVVESSKPFLHGTNDSELFVGVSNSSARSVTSYKLEYTQTVFDICYWIVTNVCRPTSFVNIYTSLLL